jgi:8-oxo-dGTP pyrophosphatase MutT (NUDIX family)
MQSFSRVLNALEAYQSFWLRTDPSFGKTASVLQDFQELLQNYPNCFEGSRLEGHITSSALVLNPGFDQILLTHHRKLNRWLQLGGHCDGNPHPWETALREVEEESGMAGFSLNFLPKNQSADSNPLILDLDIHEIPERPNEPRHLHYDIRFALMATRPDSIVCSDESHSLRWIGIDEVSKLTSEPSILRMIRRLQLLGLR